MNKLTLATLTLGTAIGLTTAANANVDVMTFEGLQNGESINSYYNGGTGGNGSGPGPNFGVSFTSNSLAIISNASGGSGNFTNAPSGHTIAFFLTGVGDTMNVAAGFTTGFSFFYADQVGFTGVVDVYSGLDGTGTLLASLSLPSTPNPYNVFVPIGVSFSGTAESVVFGGSANFIGFDNITIGASSPGGTPEPSTWAMMLIGFAGLGFAGYRSSRKTAALAA
jgi:PEP-CTERM motif